MDRNNGIERFIFAQENFTYNYKVALSEIRAGRKATHWIWYIFPNIAGLGSSEMSRKYAIRDINEAREYIANDFLRNNLIEITQAVYDHEDLDILEIMSWSVDVLKLKSCMTLFAVAAPEYELFRKVLDKYFDGKPDNNTLRILNLPKSYKF